MAARKESVANPAPIDTGFSSGDMGIPVLSVVQSLSKPFKNGTAKFGDLVIGMNAEDPDTQVVYSNKAGDSPLKVYMIAPAETWMQMRYGQGDGRWDMDGTPRPLWDGTISPRMPPNAQKNCRYTLMVPSYSEVMPVHFYVKGTAERSMVGMVNKIRLSAAEGVYPYQLAFAIATRHISSGTNEWYVPDVSLVEPEPEHVAIGAVLYAELSAAPQRQIEAGAETVDDATKPGF